MVYLILLFYCFNSLCNKLTKLSITPIPNKINDISTPIKATPSHMYGGKVLNTKIIPKYKMPANRKGAVKIIYLIRLLFMFL